MKFPDVTEPFDEESYLTRYPDVAYAVTMKYFPSGYSHFIACGLSEGRVGLPLIRPELIDISQSSREDAFLSPAFSTSPPILFNADLMPLDLEGMYSQIWNQTRPTSEVVCSILSDVIVDGSGLVFDNKGRLYAHTTRQAYPYEIDPAVRRVRAYLERENTKVLPGVTLLCEKSGLTNYGHWLVEMLPLVYFYAGKLKNEWFLRAPFTNNIAMNNVIRDSIELVGIEPSRIRWGMSGLPQRYEKLAIIQGFSEHGSFYSPRSVECLEYIASKVPCIGSHKIWVNRENTSRKLQNESALCETLEGQGWIIANLDDVPLHKQIELFKGAEIIAGVNGAGLTNLAFGNASTKILSFVPNQMPDSFFWMISQFKRQRYFEVRCNQEDNSRREYSWNSKLMIDNKKVLEFIDKVVKS